VPRLPSRRLLLAALAAAAAAMSASPAVAQPADDDSPVDVIEVDGYLDPVLVDFIERTIDRAEASDSVALVLQLDSPGSVVDAERLDALVERIEDTSVPVAVWVGPPGAAALGDAARLVDAADHVGVAPGAEVEMGGERLDGEAASEAGLADIDAPTLGDLIVSLPGVEVREVPDGDLVRREPVTPVRFSQLPVVDQLMHTVASPPVAYLLFVVGMALLVLELYTAGIGIAGGTGAVCVILAAYGLTVLPTNPLGVGLLTLSTFGYAVDVQSGAPRVWTAIATTAFASGSLLLYDGIDLPWYILVVAVIAVVLFYVGAMPAMVRSRFSTSTIGRDWMIGAEGEARSAIDPDGVVIVRDAPWRARTNRATPIPAGAPVRVAAIEGLVLEVEPLEGAARDYRDRRRRRANLSSAKSEASETPIGSGDGADPAGDRL
jgi:membrane-bound serine protease (ClpP class)